MVQQIKGVNTTSRQWVGIKIIMFVNHLHPMMTRHSFNADGVNDLVRLNEIKNNAIDRDAFMERLRFFELMKQHIGKTDADFPFDATDMARFILRVLAKSLPDISEELASISE